MKENTPPIHFPKISIVVPVYNEEERLPVLIKSLLGQSFADFELILVNNRSTDGSLFVCQRYAQIDKRIKIVSEEKPGVSNARNAGINVANGEWIGFCDADDDVDYQYLQSFMNIENKEVDLLIQSFYYIRGEDRTIVDLANNTDDAVSVCIRLMASHLCGVVWNKMFRRSIVNRNNLSFNSRIHFKEDEDFVLRYLLYTRCAKSTKESHYYYQAPNFDAKYGIHDNFFVHLSIFSSISKLLYKDDVEESVAIRTHYLLLLSNAYFNSFAIQRCDDLENRYAMFRTEVKSYLNYLPELSAFSKWVIKHVGNKKIATALFKLKYSLNSLIGTFCK